MTPTELTTLAQTWIHSHEEDQADQLVYRPASFPFPPSRGRAGFDLNPDGTMVEFGPSPTDRTITRACRWETREGGLLEFCLPDAATPYRVLKIASMDPEKLVFQKKPK